MLTTSSLSNVPAFTNTYVLPVCTLYYLNICELFPSDLQAKQCDNVDITIINPAVLKPGKCPVK